MIKHVLVPVGGVPTDAAPLKDIVGLVRPFSADVEAFRHDPRNDLPLYGEGFFAEILQQVSVALVGAAHDLNDGLLVIGGYGDSRVREVMPCATC